MKFFQIKKWDCIVWSVVHSDSSLNWLIDWLIDCSIDWLIDWLTPQLIDWLMDSSIDWSIDWLFIRLIDCFLLFFQNSTESSTLDAFVLHDFQILRKLNRNIQFALIYKSFLSIGHETL